MSGGAAAMKRCHRKESFCELAALFNFGLLILMMSGVARSQLSAEEDEIAGPKPLAAAPGGNLSLAEWQSSVESESLLLVNGGGGGADEATTAAAAPPALVAAAAAADDEAETTSTSTTESSSAVRITHPPLKRPSFLDHAHLLPPDGQRRYGPYFEDGLGPFNVTARVGSTVLLDCRIGMLQDKTVTWIQRKEDSIHLLTVGKQAYSNDARFSLNFRYPNNWRLQILFVSRRDEATYECQVATHPPRVLQVTLRVSAPELHILDEHGHAVWDRYYKVGSRVELLCEASRVQESPSTVEWRQAGVSLAAVAKNHSRPELSVTPGTLVGKDTVRTVLTLQRARKEDSGNYTCVVADIAEATVTVHILNGELPAAVQHGTSGQAPVTPLLGVLVILSHLVVTCQSR